MNEGKFKYFVLLAQMRTGSNLFESHLNEFTTLSCHGELFNPEFVGYPYKKSVVDVALRRREKDPYNVLRQLIETVEDSLPGFRLFSGHDHRIQKFCIEDPECAKIILTRNPLDSFISQCIAEKTDQWKMIDLHKRKKTKVEFDFAQFKDYFLANQKHLQSIQHDLQHAGQTAFYLSYEDLHDVDAFNGLANYLGSHERLKKLSQKMVRQNPEPLAEKVTNYAELKKEIRKLDIIDGAPIPVAQQRSGFDARDVIKTDTPPVMFVPINQSNEHSVTSWLQTYAGSDGLSHAVKKPDLNNWLAATPNRSIITLLEHPLARVFHAFNTYVFRVSDDTLPWVRSNLIEFYNLDLPESSVATDPTREALQAVGYTKDKYKAAFEGFLKFVKGNLKGQTRTRIHPSWNTQFDRLNNLSDWVYPDLIIHPNEIDDAFRYLEGKHNLEHCKTKLSRKVQYPFALEEIYDAKLEKYARAAYVKDYNRFGFDDWSG